MKHFFNTFIIFYLFACTLSAQVVVPNDWYYGGTESGFNGISMHEAYAKIIKNQPNRPVVVAVIDSGIDIEHEDLMPNIWVNKDEIPNNGIDDDKNGYVDDIHGWNFIGGPNGKNVGPDTYEATRVYGMLKYKYENANPNKLNKEQKKEYDLFIRAKENVEAEINKAKANIDKINSLEEKVMASVQAVEDALLAQNLTLDSLDKLKMNDDMMLTMGTNIVTQYVLNENKSSISDIKMALKNDIESDKQNQQNKLDYAFNPEFDPRKTIVKDNYADAKEKYYGNNDVEGPDAMHGTHVAGIIGAVRNNEIGMDGIAPNVQLMSVRAVPDGDERDKDVANAIRYAVDNGATVINMSFGKGFGTHKKLVDEAVKYAADKDVLLVHAAGNSAQDNDSTDNFPNDAYEKKGGLFCKKQKYAKNWIEVGAMSYNTGEDMVAPFSNYGKNNVDIFAPGMKIYSTMPDNSYAPLQGTSMASPVVAGIAATIRSVYPALTAEQVKEAILNGSVPMLDIEVKVPGKKGTKTKFSDISTTGAIVNLEKALLYAAKMKGKKKVSKDRISLP